MPCIASATRLNCLSGLSVAKFLASIPSSFNALTASPVPCAASDTRRTILCRAMFRVSVDTPVRRAWNWSFCNSSVATPSLTAVLANLSTSSDVCASERAIKATPANTAVATTAVNFARFLPTRLTNALTRLLADVSPLFSP